MHSPRLFLWQLNICRQGAVHWDADIITLSVGPCRETTSSQQCSEIYYNRMQKCLNKLWLLANMTKRNILQQIIFWLTISKFAQQ